MMLVEAHQRARRRARVLPGPGSPARPTWRRRRSGARSAGTRRLVDYTLHDGLGASDLARRHRRRRPGGNDPGRRRRRRRRGERAGGDVRGRAAACDDLASRRYAVDARRNGLEPHVWDEDDTCLPVGATELYVAGRTPRRSTTCRRRRSAGCCSRRPSRPVRVAARVAGPPDVGREHDRPGARSSGPTSRGCVWPERRRRRSSSSCDSLGCSGNLVPHRRRTETARCTAELPRIASRRRRSRGAAVRAVERAGRRRLESRHLFTLPDRGPRGSRLGAAAGRAVAAGGASVGARLDDRPAGPPREWAWRRSLHRRRLARRPTRTSRSTTAPGAAWSASGASAGELVHTRLRRPGAARRSASATASSALSPRRGHGLPVRLPARQRPARQRAGRRLTTSRPGARPGSSR